MSGPRSNSESDLQLFQQIKGGSRVAFRRLYDRYWKILFHSSSHFLKSDTGAKDVVQEIFTDLWVRRESLTIQNVSAYLNQAVRFQSLKQLRKQQPADIHEEKFQDILRSNCTQEKIEFTDLLETLEVSLNQLPEKYKEIFEMSRLKDMSNKEIADKLKLSRRTVEWYVGAVLKHLKASMLLFQLIVLIK
ncbi:MAG: sigma-70 family RNA polymerase sigma factor [Bacteroidota bacterium]